MNKFKSLLFEAPEYILILLTVFYWVSAGVLLNPIAIGFVSLLLFQIVKRKRGTGLILAILFILISVFMLLALLSELSEFSGLNKDASQMLIVGMVFLLSSLFASGLMLYKYSR